MVRFCAIFIQSNAMCTTINKQPKTIRTKQKNWAKMCSNFVIWILLWVNGKGGAGRVQGKWPLVEGGHRVQLPDQISVHCPPLLPNSLKTSTMFIRTSSFYQNYHTSHSWPIHKVLRDPLNDLFCTANTIAVVRNWQNISWFQILGFTAFRDVFLV